MSISKESFLNWEKASRDSIDFKKCYVDISGDVISGLLLSQIVYWHLSDSYGNSKLRIEKFGHLWLAKARYDWWDECRISPKQFDRACAELEQKQIIVTHVSKFAGNPTKHIRLNWDVFLILVEEAVSNVPENPYYPKGKNQDTQGTEVDLSAPQSQPSTVSNQGLSPKENNGYSHLVNNVVTQTEKTLLPFGELPLTEITAKNTTQKTSKIEENDSHFFKHQGESKPPSDAQPLTHHPVQATENRFRAYTRNNDPKPWLNADGTFSEIAIEGVLLNFETLPGVFFKGTNEPNLGKVNQLLRNLINKGELEKLNDFCLSGKRSLELKQKQIQQRQESEKSGSTPDGFDDWYASSSQINPATGRQCAFKTVQMSGKVQITIQHPFQAIMDVADAMQRYPKQYWNDYIAEREKYYTDVVLPAEIARAERETVLAEERRLKAIEEEEAKLKAKKEEKAALQNNIEVAAKEFSAFAVKLQESNGINSGDTLFKKSADLDFDEDECEVIYLDDEVQEIQGDITIDDPGDPRYVDF